MAFNNFKGILNNEDGSHVGCPLGIVQQGEFDKLAVATGIN
jgi:hypothetical protein